MRRWLPILAFVVLAATSGAALARIERQADKTINSLREECERTNVLRINQALALADQVKQTKAALRGDLGALEEFRAQVKEGLRLREGALQRLRDSTSDHPVAGRVAARHPVRERPYRVDCEAAYQ